MVERALRWRPGLVLMVLLVAFAPRSAVAQPAIEFVRTDYAVGNRPTGVAIGDLNGDGHADIVTVNYGVGSVTRLLGAGTGTFGDRLDLLDESGAFAVALGDLDGNGTLDIAVANIDYSAVSVFFGDGAGGFGPAKESATGMSPVAIAIADLNGDGKLDIVTANRNGNSISVLLGTGGGNFAPAANFPMGQYPYGLAIADLNHDGKPDVVATNYYDNTLSVRLGDGAGGFGPIATFATAAAPTSVAIADLNGDGNPDLAVTGSGANSVGVLFGDGAGGFGPRADYPTGTTPLTVAIGDMNGDGLPDLVVANRDSKTVSVLLAAAGGAFNPKVDSPTGTTTWGVAIGNLNGDAMTDLVVTNADDNTVSTLLQFKEPRAPTSTSLVSSPNPSEVAQPVTLTATVSPGAATGTVTFLDDTRTLGTATLSGGVATLSTASLAAGSHSLAATYSGDVAHEPSSSPPVAQTVNYAASATTIVSSVNPAQLLQSVRFTATVAGVTTGAPVPTGSAQFTIDGTNFGPAVALAGGQATSQTTSSLPAGSHTVQAFYLGSAIFSPSGSAPLIQVVEDSRTPTSTSLVSSPNPSDAGQSVTLTATVTPGQAGGNVTFLDGAQTLATAILNSGTASFSSANLAVGSHTLTAKYAGNASYQPSSSAPVVQTVSYAASATTVVSSANPAQILQSVQFTATVSGVTTGEPVPTGSVQFTIDGTSFGSTVPLAGGQASQATSSLSVGSHTVKALYLGSPIFTPSTSTPLTQVVVSPIVIVGVRDVPNDQGGRVFLTWRCSVDQPGVNVVTGYRVWRRDPNPTAAARARGRATPDRTSGVLVETFWEAIATLPAQQLVSYAFTAPTTQDSMQDGNPYTAFFVTALTADPFTFYESAPDSGYSVDNLAPPTPAPFTATYGPITTALHWGANPAPDLREFRLYRGLSPDFVPGSANLVVATRDTGYVDPVRTPYVYKLDAVDVHGNASRYAMVTPGGPVAVLASLASIVGSPDRIRITWYAAANPGLAATVYRSEGGGWTAIAVISADARGYLSYEDTRITSGRIYGYRLGIMDGGVEVFVGEAWALADRLMFALQGVRPNPSVGSDLTVRFSLPSAEPAKLELIDVGGRRIAAQEVGDLGPGEHAVNLAGGLRLAPGIYLVRLSQAGLVQVTRAAVIR